MHCPNCRITLDYNSLVATSASGDATHDLFRCGPFCPVCATPLKLRVRPERIAALQQAVESVPLVFLLVLLGLGARKGALWLLDFANHLWYEAIPAALLVALSVVGTSLRHRWLECVAISEAEWLAANQGRSWRKITAIWSAVAAAIFAILAIVRYREDGNISIPGVLKLALWSFVWVPIVSTLVYQGEKNFLARRRAAFASRRPAADPAAAALAIQQRTARSSSAGIWSIVQVAMLLLPLFLTAAGGRFAVDQMRAIGAMTSTALNCVWLAAGAVAGPTLILVPMYFWHRSRKFLSLFPEPRQARGVRLRNWGLGMAAGNRSAVKKH